MKSYNPYLKLLLITLLMFITMLLVAHGTAKSNQILEANSIAQYHGEQAGESKITLFPQKVISTKLQLNTQATVQNDEHPLITDAFPLENTPPPLETNLSNTNVFEEDGKSKSILALLFFISIYVCTIYCFKLVQTYYFNLRALISSLTLSWFIPIKASLL